MELNKCPKCGSDDVSLWLCGRNSYSVFYYIACNDCGNKTKDYPLEIDAYKEWNKS